MISREELTSGCLESPERLSKDLRCCLEDPQNLGRIRQRQKKRSNSIRNGPMFSRYKPFDASQISILASGSSSWTIPRGRTEQLTKDHFVVRRGNSWGESRLTQLVTLEFHIRHHRCVALFSRASAATERHLLRKRRRKRRVPLPLK